MGFLSTEGKFRDNALKQATAASFQIPLPRGKNIVAVIIIIIFSCYDWTLYSQYTNKVLEQTK
jgi:hypothetical protein